MPIPNTNEAAGAIVTANPLSNAPRVEFQTGGSLALATIRTEKVTVAGQTGGGLSFETNRGAAETTRAILIDSKGNVGIGDSKLDPQFRLHVDGDAKFTGPLTVDRPESGPSLTVLGAAKIGDISIDGSEEVLTVEGDTTVIGNLAAGPLAVSDKVGLGVEKVLPDATTSAPIILDVGSRMRVRQRAGNTSGIWFHQISGGDKAFVGMENDNKVGFWNHKLRHWGLTINLDNKIIETSGLLKAPSVGIDVPEVLPDATTSAPIILDVGSRMRVRQRVGNTSGIWFHQLSGGDKAFVGMVDDNRVGFWGQALRNWGLTVNTNNGFSEFFASVDETILGNHPVLRVNVLAKVPHFPPPPRFTTITRTPLFVHSRGVGINTDNPSFALDVAGVAHATSFQSSSDVRFKTNVTELHGVLEKLRYVRAVSFDWNELHASLGRSTGKREIGVIAQELETVFPDLVTEWGEEKYKALDYGRLSAVLLEAVKELAADNEKLTQRVQALETQNRRYSS